MRVPTLRSDWIFRLCLFGVYAERNDVALRTHFRQGGSNARFAENMEEVHWHRRNFLLHSDVVATRKSWLVTSRAIELQH